MGWGWGPSGASVVHIDHRKAKWLVQVWTGSLGAGDSAAPPSAVQVVGVSTPSCRSHEIQLLGGAWAPRLGTPLLLHWTPHRSAPSPCQGRAGCWILTWARRSEAATGPSKALLSGSLPEGHWLSLLPGCTSGGHANLQPRRKWQRPSLVSHGCRDLRGAHGALTGRGLFPLLELPCGWHSPASHCCRCGVEPEETSPVFLGCRLRQVLWFLASPR